MAFTPKANLPDLPKGAERAIIEQFRAVGVELRALNAPAEVVTELLRTDSVSTTGELVRACPPAGGMRILLPPGTPQNDSESVRVALENVDAGGSVTVSVVGASQPINGADTLVISTVGLTEFVSLGPSGWSAMGNGVGGGGGAIADGVYGSITVSGGGTIFRVTDGVYGDVTVSGGGLIWTVAGGSVAMTDATITLGFTGAHSGTAVVVDAAIGAASNVGIFWGDVLDTDANSPETDAVTFSCIPAVGSMTVRVSSDKEPVGGAYKIRYLIG